MVALREDQETVCKRSGIWITILYGVYLYGEKCSGITVRSLRSAVPAAARKTHLERRRNRETRWRRASRAPEARGSSMDFIRESFRSFIERHSYRVIREECNND